MKKRLSVFLIAMLIGGLVFVNISYFGMVHAESSIPKPSIPEFTVKFVDHSYDIPPTYGIDPYTGKKVMTQSGYHIQNKSIELTIKNQPFIVSNYVLFYNIRLKGHFNDSWGYYPGVEEYLQASNSDYTVLTFGLYGNNGTEHYSTVANLDVSAGGQVDFQVQAFRGCSTTIEGPPDPLFHKPTYQTTYTGETSGWSNTQTITIDSQNPTVLNWTEIALFTAFGVLVALVIVAIALVRRRRSLQNANSTLPKSKP